MQLIDGRPGREGTGVLMQHFFFASICAHCLGMYVMTGGCHSA
jgi:hypothetical protein